MGLLRKNKTHILLVIILAIAAFVRLYRIGDYLTFLGDEGRDVLVVYNILHGHLTLLGPTSSVGGFFLGPIYYYFMAPFLWIFHYDPVGPAVMVALFGVVTVWLMYYIGRKFFNPTAGIVAALLYAISPLVITYSRSSWNPNLMPITTLLIMFTLYKAVSSSTSEPSTLLRQENFSLSKRSASKGLLSFLLSGILFGVAIQLHYIEVFVGVIIIFYILLTGGKHIVKTIKNLLVVGLGFIIGWSPFLAFELRHGFNNIRAILNFVFHPSNAGNGVGAAGNSFMIIGNVFFRLFGRLLLNVPTPDMYSNFTSGALQLWSIAAWVIGFSCLVFLLGAIFIWRKDRTKFLQYTLLASWLFLGIFFFGLYKKNIYDYYFEFLFPVPFLLFGGLFSFLFSKAIWLRVVCLFILVSVVVINVQGVPFRYAPNQQLLQTKTIAKFILDQTNNQSFNFALITGGNSDHAYRYFFTIWGHPPVTIQYPGVDPKRTSVTNQLLVVCESLPCYPLGNSLWEIAGFGRAQIAGEWDVSVVKVYKLSHYMGK